jgi:hypothetical protein
MNRLPILSLQTKQLLLNTVLLLVLLAGQPFLWRFVLSSAQSLQDRRTVEQQLANLRERLTVIDETQAQQAGLFGQLDEVFLPLDSTPQAVERLEQLADLQGVVLEIQNIREETPIGSQSRNIIIPLRVTLKATGQPDRLLEYIDAIEHVPEVTVVDEWVLRSFLDNSSGTGTQVIYELSVNIVFYFQPTGGR